MRRLFLIALAILFTAGIANADIGGTSEPKNYPIVWTVTAYNGSGDDISSGQVVRWDIDASTTDMAAWIEEGDTIADIRTAGAIPYGRDCINGQTCQVIIWGPAIMYHGTNTVTVNTGVEADAAGQPVDETLGAADEALLGWVAKATAGTAANTTLSSQYSVIFIDPTPYSGD